MAGLAGPVPEVAANSRLVGKQEVGTWPNCLNAKSKRSTRCYKKLNSVPKLIQRTTSVAPQRLCTSSDSMYTRRRSAIALRTRLELECWIPTMPQPRMIAMEATIFTGWIYDHLLPHAEKVKVAHPVMLRAIAAAKKKNDKIDAGKIADCLRCDFLPECHMASTEIRNRRRTLRYRNLVIKQMVQMKNRVSGLLMETGVSYNKQRLHKVGYFADLMSTNEEVNESIRPLAEAEQGDDLPLAEARLCLWSVRSSVTHFSRSGYGGLGPCQGWGRSRP